MSEANALLTGATGFLGGHVVPALRTLGWSVAAIVRPESTPERVSALRNAGCVTYVHDGGRPSLERIVEAVQPTCTWHLAAHFVAVHAASDLAPLIHANVEFGALLLDVLSDRIETPAVVTVGTAWQQHNNAVYAPMSLYAATKQAFDSFAAFYAGVRKMRIVECLLFDTFGPNDPRRKLLWALSNAATTQVPLKLSGDGSQFMDLLHVEDVVRALIVAGKRALAAAPGASERWAVRSEEPVTVRALVERFERARGVAVPVEWNARPPRPREMTVPWTAGEVLPGWRARIGLDEGLAAIV